MISSTLPATTSEDEDAEEEEWNVTPTPAFCAPPFDSQISGNLVTNSGRISLGGPSWGK